VVFKNIFCQIGEAKPRIAQSTRRL